MKKRMTVAAIAASAMAALPSWGADGRYASPVYSMGKFDPDYPTSSTYMQSTSQLAFKGLTLDDLKAMVDDGYSLFGCMSGSYIAERNLIGSFYNLQAYPASGTIEKIVGDFSRLSSSGMEQAVCVQLTNGVDGVYAVSTKRLYKNSQTSAEYAFVTLDSSGNATYDGEYRNEKLHEVDLATSASSTGYGVCGVQCAKFVPSASSSLVWAGATLAALKNAAFSGFFGGAAVPAGLRTTGYNTKTTDDGAGNVTEIQTEFQVSYNSSIRCVVVKFTDGTDGVHAQAVASLYADSSVGLGYAFANDDGTYNGTATAFASDYSQDSTTNTRQGVYGLIAMRSGCSYSGFLQKTSTLVWSGVTLDDIKDFYFGGVFSGGYSGVSGDAECIGCNKVVAVDGDGSATSITVEFQVNDGAASPKNCLKCVRAVFTDGDGGVYGQATRACYSWNNDVGFEFGATAGLNNTNATVVTTANAGGYAVKDVFATPCVTLDHDEDWSASPDASIALDDIVVDLNGHGLVASVLTAAGDHVTVVNGKTNETATLEFAIPSGSVTNTGVVVGKKYIQSGNVKVVKSGAGTLNVATAQWNTGGWEVAEGTLAKGASNVLGAEGGEVVVRGGAVVEMNAHTSTSHEFVLDGGTLRNANASATENQAQLASVRLESDSSFDFPYAYGLIGAGYAATTLDLGGNTLTASLGAVNFFLYNATVENGTVDITSGGTLRIDKTGAVATNVDFRIACALNVIVPFKVRGYEAAYANAYNQGSYPLQVLGAFKPTVQYYHGCEMQDGSTMDLTAWPSASGWPMYSRSSSNGNRTMSFADGTVNVALDMTRTDMVALADTKAGGEYAGYLIKWGSADGTLATRNEHTVFALDAESAVKYRLVADATGLLLRRKGGLCIVVR